MLILLSTIVNKVIMTLKEYLEKKCLNHTKFALSIGLKRSAFSRYVNGSRKVPLDTAIKIKKASKDVITEFNDLITAALS